MAKHRGHRRKALIAAKVGFGTRTRDTVNEALRRSPRAETASPGRSHAAKATWQTEARRR
jgi:hypothetical protein